MPGMEPAGTIATRVAQIRAEQDPWTRARMAGAGVMELMTVFDESVAAIWTLHVQRRGAATLADTLGVPISLLLGAIGRATRVGPPEPEPELID
jgi:hypothetical protein